MSQVMCLGCKKKIDSSAKSCPQCGREDAGREGQFFDHMHKAFRSGRSDARNFYNESEWSTSLWPLRWGAYAVIAFVSTLVIWLGIFTVAAVVLWLLFLVHVVLTIAGCFFESKSSLREWMSEIASLGGLLILALGATALAFVLPPLLFMEAPGLGTSILCGLGIAVVAAILLRDTYRFDFTRCPTCKAIDIVCSRSLWPTWEPFYDPKYWCRKCSQPFQLSHHHQRDRELRDADEDAQE